MSSIFGLLLFLLLLTLVLHVVGRILRVPIAADSYQCRAWLPSHWREPLEDGEEIHFEAADGAPVVGTFLPRLTETTRGVVVYSHELGGDRWNALPYVEHLRSDGFDVLTFDYRDHRAKDPSHHQERLSEVSETDLADFRGAIQAAIPRCSGAVPRVGVIGVGKGAAVALAVAAEEPAIRGLVLDSLQPTADATSSPPATSLVGWWCRLISRVYFRTSCQSFDPAEAAARVQIPVLLIQGSRDGRVSLDAVRTLASQIAGQCQLWIVPGARHAEAVGSDRNAYQRRTSKFLIQAMQTKPAAEREKSHTTAPPVAHHQQVSSAPAR